MDHICQILEVGVDFYLLQETANSFKKEGYWTFSVTRDELKAQTASESVLENYGPNRGGGLCTLIRKEFMAEKLERFCMRDFILTVIVFNDLGVASQKFRRNLPVDPITRKGVILINVYFPQSKKEKSLVWQRL